MAVTHILYGNLIAKLQLYNRSGNHNKMYVVTMWRNPGTDRYHVIPYYGRIETFEDGGGDFRRLQKGKDYCVSALNHACHNFNLIARQKVGSRGYTTDMDGVSPVTPLELPNATQLMTAWQRLAPVIPPHASDLTVMDVDLDAIEARTVAQLTKKTKKVQKISSGVVKRGQFGGRKRYLEI